MASLLRRRSSLSTAGRPELIEASPDGQFIKASSNRKGQPLHLALGGSIRYCAAKQFINGRPATDLIEAGPDGQFIKAAIFYTCPNGFYERRSNPMAVLSRQASADGRFIKANGRFIKAGHF